MGFFEKLKAGLSKTKNAVIGKIDGVLKSFVRVDEDLLDELEEILYCSDMGAETTEEVIEALRGRIKDGRLKDPEEVKGALKEILRSMIGDSAELDLSTHPSVILVIGVNGVGKTTTIGKISAKLKDVDFVALGAKQYERVKADDVFSPELCAEIASLPKRTISRWIEIDGWSFLVRKDGEEPGASQTFEEAYDKIAGNVKEEAARKAYLAWIDRLRAETYVKVF